jgi:hypothetical protein
MVCANNYSTTYNYNEGLSLLEAARSGTLVSGTKLPGI